MSWAWAASLDQIWRSPNLPLYLTLATACFVGIIVLITLLRSERSVANGVLALITLLGVGVAGAATFGGLGTANVVQSTEARAVQTVTAPATPIASSVMSASTPLATDLSERSRVIRTMIPTNPPVASVRYNGRFGERQI